MRVKIDSEPKEKKINRRLKLVFLLFTNSQLSNSISFFDQRNSDRETRCNLVLMQWNQLICTPDCTHTSPNSLVIWSIIEGTSSNWFACTSKFQTNSIVRLSADFCRRHVQFGKCYRLNDRSTSQTETETFISRVIIPSLLTCVLSFLALKQSAIIKIDLLILAPLDPRMTINKKKLEPRTISLSVLDKQRAWMSPKKGHFTWQVFQKKFYTNIYMYVPPECLVFHQEKH